MTHQLLYHKLSRPFFQYLPLSPRGGPFQKVDLLPDTHVNAEDPGKESLVD